MILTDTFTGLTEIAEEWIEDQLANPKIKVRKIKREPVLATWGSATKVTLEYEESMEQKGILHMKAYKNLDELNKYLKALNPNLVVEHGYSGGITFYLFETPLVSVCPPDIRHVNGWWSSSEFDPDFIESEGMLTIFITVLEIAKNLIDKFNDSGINDFLIMEGK